MATYADIDLSTITDTFTDASNTFWNSGDKSIVSGRAAGFFTHDNFDDPYDDYGNGPTTKSAGSPMLTSNGVTIRTYAGSWTMQFKWAPSGGGQIYAGVYNGTLSISGAFPFTTLAYSATAHAYIRFRAAGGNAYVDASPDRTTWTTLVSAPSYAGTDSIVGKFFTISGSTGGTLDDLNLTSVASGPVRKVSAYIGGTWTLKPVLALIGGSWVEKPNAKRP